jgi:hypothetical protein
MRATSECATVQYLSWVTLRSKSLYLVHLAFTSNENVALQYIHILCAHAL